MNERIRELAEQARSEVRADWDKANKIPYPEAHYVFQRDNDQKFAELIVRECMCISDSIGEHGYIAAEEMGKHFGVEE